MQRPGRRRWKLAAPAPDVVGRLEAELGVSPLLARLLANRDLEDPAAAEVFLEARLSRHLRSPMLFRDMGKAADRILRAVESREAIGIYGDYDVDGVSGTSILVRFLRELGVDPLVHIPNRMRDGYGLNARGVRSLAERGAGLMITVDCGAVSHDEIALASSLGMDAVVCDHHEVSEQPLPALAVLNPVEPGGGFPFTGLCGAGVAFYLAMGVRMRLRERSGARGPDVRRLLDLAALGTVADIVPLVEENRVLVKYGMAELEGSTQPGVVALKRVSDVREVSAGAIGFRLGPRLNAGGRLDDAAHGVELLTTADVAVAERLAVFLDQENRKRQAIEQGILDDAVRRIEADGGAGIRRGIVLACADWHAGVIGIVASRLVERYHRPTILIALDPESGTGRGSARSIPALDIYQAIDACGDTLQGFGGHPMAAGMTVQADRVDDLARRFEAAVAERTTEDDFVPVVNVDAELSVDAVDQRCMEDLARLEPHGAGNRKPVFVARGVRVRERRVVGRSHLKLVVEQGGRSMQAIAFGMGETPVQPGDSLDVLHSPVINEWNGRRTLELKLSDLKRSGVQEKYVKTAS